MKLKSLLFVIAASAVLAGCANGPDLARVSDLKVYPDNRVGYTLVTRGTSPARVWSTGETILALRFDTRIINAKDLDNLVAYQTNKKNVPLHIAVRLKSGESLVADVAGWGMSVYSDLTVEWLACSREKKCETLFPTSITPPANFLAFFSESWFEALLSPGAKLQTFVTYENGKALPSHSDYRLNFTDVNKIIDMSAGIESARVKKAKLDKCNSEAGKARDRWIKLTEEKIVATTPPADVQRKLAQVRGSFGNPTSNLVGWEAGCTSQFD